MVPAYPNVTAQGAYEFHAGFLSLDNSVFIKTTISYGCQVSANKGCFAPFLNRYVFYLSIINLRQLCGGQYCRTQYPSGGIPLVVGSQYQITLAQKNGCVTFGISNETASFSKTVCNSLTNKNFTTVISGMIEEHNITSCSKLSDSGSFVQSNFTAFSRSGQPYNLQWTPSIYGGDCNESVSFLGTNTTISWA